MSIRTRMTAFTIVALLATGPLAACTSTDHDTDAGSQGQSSTPSAPGAKIATSLTALIQRALSNTSDLSSFERDVLERSLKTGQIDPADYEEAYSRYRTCITDAGYQVTLKKLSSGIYQETPVLPSAVSNGDATNAKKWADAYGAASKKCAIGTTATIEALYALQQGNSQLLSDPNEVVAQCLVKAGLVPSSYTADDFKALLEANFQNPPFDLNSSAAQTCFANAGMAVATR